MDDSIQQTILEAAKAFVEGQAWPWLEPVDVRLERAQTGERAWSVRTNVHARGRSVRLVIRESDLSVIESAYLPR
jgi:hypothetical protein